LSEGEDGAQKNLIDVLKIEKIYLFFEKFRYSNFNFEIVQYFCFYLK